MEIVYSGSLESISRPSSSASEKGRKSHLKKPLQASSSLEVLPPEDISAVPKELLFSAVEDDVDIEDCEYDDSSCSEIEEVDQLSDEVEEDINRDGHKSRSSKANSAGSNEDLPALEDSDVDPKIREGMEKIKKLDKILTDKVKKEKEIKAKRFQMEKMWKEQLQQMVKVNEKDGSNTNLLGAALLALELGNEESLGSSRDDPSTPIFPTQPLGSEELHSHYQASSSSVGRTSRGSTTSSTSETKSKRNKSKNKNTKESRRKSERGKGANTSKKTGKNKDAGQDFIERNKKLAADAANVIPMTEEEKQRLEHLLSGDINEMMEDNPFNDDGSLRLTQGVGFTPDQESARALADIERKLEALVPSNELEMLSSRSSTDTPLSHHSGLSKTDSQVSSRHSHDNLDDIDIGEKVLREEKETRTVQQRILDIERQLEKLRQLSDDETDDTISQALLDRLLNNDSRTTSSSSTIAETVVASLTTPDFLTIEGTDSSTSHRTLSKATERTISAMSDISLTSDVTNDSDVTLSVDTTLTRDVTPTNDFAKLDVDTPRTLTDSLDTWHT